MVGAFIVLAVGAFFFGYFAAHAEANATITSLQRNNRELRGIMERSGIVITDEGRSGHADEPESWTKEESLAPPTRPPGSNLRWDEERLRNTE